MPNWIDELPEEVRETVRNNTKDLVPKNTGEWVPASKINEVKNKTLEQFKDYEQLKQEAEKVKTLQGEIETYKGDIEKYKGDLEKHKATSEYEKKLRNAGVVYPELFVGQEEQDIEQLKTKYPMYFKKVETNSQGSGDNQPTKTPEQIREQEINNLKDKPNKTRRDYARLFSLLNKKE
jgi:uncharacterized membrane-anchored protein YhcB (DUF1043 family)